MAGALGIAAALAVASAPAATAGTAGPTESLGSAKGLEYLSAKHADVAIPAGARRELPVRAERDRGWRLDQRPGERVAAALEPSRSNTTGDGWLATGASLGGGGEDGEDVCDLRPSVTNTYIPGQLPSREVPWRQRTCSVAATARGGGLRESPRPRDARAPLRTTATPTRVLETTGWEATFVSFRTAMPVLDLRLRALRPEELESTVAKTRRGDRRLQAGVRGPSWPGNDRLTGGGARSRARVPGTPGSPAGPRRRLARGRR